MEKISRFGKHVACGVCLILGLSLILARETIKRLLAFPVDTKLDWKSHDDSIAQRSAIEHARHEKGGGSGSYHGTGRRRDTIHEDPTAERSKT